MRSQLVLAGLILVGASAPVTLQRDTMVPQKQSAIVRFERSTWVAGQMLIGTYVIVHDEDNMTRGDPCTALYLVGAGTRPREEAVSFHCIPRERKVVPGFTMSVNSNPALGVDTLTEYQFAGDSEGHGVPIAALASDRLHVPESVVCVR